MTPLYTLRLSEEDILTIRIALVFAEKSGTTMEDFRPGETYTRVVVAHGRAVQESPYTQESVDNPLMM